jgi:hypothetical protein
VNGLALCAIHHKAFDKGSLGVDENMRVQISSAVNGNSVVSRFFWDFAGSQIHLLQKENYPQASFIEWHIRKFSGSNSYNLESIKMSFPGYKEIEIPLLLNIYNRGGEVSSSSCYEPLGKSLALQMKK